MIAVDLYFQRATGGSNTLVEEKENEDITCKLAIPRRNRKILFFTKTFSIKCSSVKIFT